MLRSKKHERQPTDAHPARRSGLGSVVPVRMLAPRRRRRRAGGPAARVLILLTLAGALAAGAGAAVLQLRASQAAELAECTALALDRNAQRTYSGPCTDAASWLPGTLTALFAGPGKDSTAAAR